MKKIILFMILICFSIYGKNTGTLTDDNVLLDSLQYKTFLYFINEVNYENGLVKDRSTDFSPASIAATGFAIPVWAIGVENRWIEREKAVNLTLNLLKFLLKSDQSINDSATGYMGFYYHFLDMKTGKRMWKSELSSIDTGLLLAGIRFAVQYYDKDTPSEKLLRQLADSVTNKVDWNFFCINKEGEYKSTIAMEWDPEKQLSNFGWKGYNEALIMYIIAAGSNYKNIEEGYDTWLSSYRVEEPYKGLKHILFPPLFGHQFSHMFVDFRDIHDKYTKELGITYFENSRRAVLTQQQYSIENPYGYKGYDSLTWGITACDGPGEKYNFEKYKFLWYAGRGSSGSIFNYFDDGTIAPTAAASSIVFAPEIVIPTIKNILHKYGKEGLWGKYGFKDAFNPTANWIGTDYLGIDQGPIVIMIENYKNGFVWKYTMKDPIIKKGLEKLFNY